MIVRLAKSPAASGEPADRDFFFAVTKYAFGQRRKQLQKILSCAPPQLRPAPPVLQRAFQEMAVDPRSRPEALGVEQWVRLVNLLAAGRRKD